MAMLDALELSQCLTGDNFTDLPSAIAAYENQMRVRASQVAATTMESTAALHSKDALAYLIDVIS
jgi:2-polyprenyl-6-methoxyphenol hydroxylase-like FAD-dependent oxidoreductase